ncbi:uncharacterized protein BDR25DRAFT_197370, partial [Lindgomyces ingoldianus]
MFRRTLFQVSSRKAVSPFRMSSIRPHTSQPRSPPPSQSRIERFNRHLPKFLHKYTNALATAPVSHITAFLLLHEITAIVPLLSLVATFHYTHWLPSWFAEGTWVLQGVERFGKYFRRKGWIRSDEVSEAEREVQLEMRRGGKAWDIGEGGVRLVVEFATAYAVTKMLLPFRIVLSVWATPWFATRTVIPVTNIVKGLFGSGKLKTQVRAGSRAAGMGTFDTGAVTKSKSGK